MYAKHQNSQSAALNPQMNNVIDFPRQAHRKPAANDIQHHVLAATQAPLVKLWNREEKSPEGMNEVPLRVWQALKRQGAANRPGALCVLRLNDFRLLEETFGRHVGGKLQELVSKRLQSGLRDSDLLEPIAEDEFLLMLDGDLDDEQLVGIAQRLLQDCSGLYTLEGLRMHVNASLGIARFPLDASEPALLMRFARIALHETHSDSPTPYHFFSRKLLKQLQTRVWLSAELEEALVNDRFELHYQPLFDMQSQTILGTEALLRMRTETGELIKPDRFVPLAEEMGLIVPIGRWVMREACRQLKVWHDQGYTPLRMSVNVSPAQLADRNFVAGVCEAVEGAGIDYGDLELEITEGQVVDYLPLIETVFYELHSRGVRIAIDDFGTGYSALAYLTRMHWSTVKIDRAFLVNIPADPNAGRVVSAIIAMAGELGLQVTAEGVESVDQYRFLCQSGCHNGQGYGYAHPHPAAQLQRLLQSPHIMGW